MFVLLSLSQALAGTLVVDPQAGPFTTVGDALAAAAPLDVIEIAAGTYAETLVVDVDGLTLRGTDRVDVVLRANDVFRPGDGFLVAKGVTLTLESLTVSGGGLARALRAENSELVLREVNLRDGGMRGNGAVLYGDAGSTVALFDVRAFTGDAGNGAGGLVAIDGELLAVRTRFINGLTQRKGGALYCGPTSSCAVMDSEFVANRAGDGGAVYLEGTPGVWRRNVFCDNDALATGGYDGRGGGIWSNVDVTHHNSVFQGNRSRGLGGAVFAAAGTAKLHNTDLLGNLSVRDGAAMGTTDGAQVDLRNSLVAYSIGSSEHAVVQGTGALAATYNAFYANAAMTEIDTGIGPTNQGHDAADPQIGYIDGDCQATDVRPAPTSSLVDAGDTAIVDPDGSISDIGSTGGPYSCNRAETPGDGIDENCDGRELCWVDADGDGLGEAGEAPIASDDFDCDDLGEADNLADTCPGFDDALDCDEDGVPNGCDDPCVEAPVTPAADTGTRAISELEGGSGCGCAHPTVPSLGGLLAMLALLGTLGRVRGAGRAPRCPAG